MADLKDIKKKLFEIDLKSYIKSLVYDKTEIDTKMDGKAAANHEHGDLYYTETETDTLLNSKVDKVTGKGLSTEDFTTAEKTKLANLENTTIDAVLSGTSENPVQNQAVKSALDGKEDKTNKVTVLSESSTDTQYPSAKIVYEGLNGKADASHNHVIGEVTNLQSILDAKANTSDLASVATSGSYNDLSNKPTLSDLNGVIDVVKQENPDSGFAATYSITQGGVAVGAKINIFKDKMLRSTSVKTVGDTPTEAESDANLNTGDRYISLIVNTEDNDGATELMIPINDMFDLQKGDESTITLNNGVFSVKNGGITREKLATAVTDELDSKLEASDINASFDTKTGILTISVGESE